MRNVLEHWGYRLHPPIEFSLKDQTRYHAIFSQCHQVLNEKSLRLVAAAMVLSLGYGGQKAFHEVTGLSLDTCQLGMD